MTLFPPPNNHVQSSPRQSLRAKWVGPLLVHIDRKVYAGNGTAVEALGSLQFEAGAGEFVSLLGPSGCGKTTLLRLIAGLDTRFEGQISMEGQVINGPGLDRGIVFQEARLLPWLTVERNVAFALPKCVVRQERQQRIDHVLALVGLTKFRDAWPYQLSGGMEKRVGLARALVNLPKVLLMDEPFSALDTFAKFGLQDEVARIHEHGGLTTILVTHDVDEAVYLSDRVAVLTPAPAVIGSIYDVALPRPRCRTSEAIASIRRRILKDILEEGEGFQRRQVN